MKVLTKLVTFVLAFSLVFCTLPASLGGVESVNANSNETISVTDGVKGGAIYFDENTGTITMCDMTVTSADIPEKINGVAVTAIGKEAFIGCDKLKSITIPKGVTSIGDGAFNGCDSLKVLNIPENVKAIHRYALAFCSSLTAINVDANNKYYKSVDGVLFNKSGDTIIKYPIGKKGTSYSVPEGVTVIGENAFSFCKALEGINITKGVTSIGDFAFDVCYALKYINVDDANKAFKSEDGVLFTKSGDELICYPTSKPGKTYTTPAGVTSIRMAGFDGCRELTSLVISEGVKSIGAQAFGECSELTSVKIPEGLSTIEDDLFIWCKKLKHIEIPKGVKSIGEYAFCDCTALTSVKIPESVNTIKENAFYNCTNLKDVYYSGSKTQWKNIKTGSYNKALKNANVFYNISDNDAKIAATIRNTTISAKSTLRGRKITVTWKKSKGYRVDGYEVFRSTKKTSGYGTTPKYRTKKTNYTNSSGLKAGTRYYYKVRGYRVVDGKKVYTKWSNRTYKTVR